MEDPVYAVHPLANGAEIGYVGLNDLDPAGFQSAAKILLADSLVEHDNPLCVGRHELIDDVRADEAGPACDQERFSANLHDQAST